MSVFAFKQFSVKQSDAAMKVGTDSVLLGCLLEANHPGTTLDIGTGTGLLALMMAQRFEKTRVDAVEIDDRAAREATYNAKQSQWSERIHVFCRSFQSLTDHPKTYDLIVSNPPYYEVEHQYVIQTANRSTARHTGALAFEDLLKGIKQLLHEDGSCWMVLPKATYELVSQQAKQIGLFTVTAIQLFSKASKPYNRVIFQLQQKDRTCIVHSFVIYEEDGTYTEEYKIATKPFLLWK
jgi:tRNA1Val (adenine37-N6)-methyltransferase